MSKKPNNWFELLPPEKQVEYCSRLKGKRSSKYCTMEGSPKAGLRSAAPETVEEAPAPMTAIEEQKHRDEVALLLEKGLIKPEELMKEKKQEYYDAESEFEWAKKAEVQNLGEDLKGAARHLRNSMRDWDEKDLLVNLNIKINRSALEKKNCPDFENVEDKDLLKAYALRELLNEFPKTVPVGNDKDKDELLMQRRRQYLDAYSATVDKMRELLKDPAKTPDDCIKEIGDLWYGIAKDSMYKAGVDHLFGGSIYSKYRRIHGRNGPAGLLRMATKRVSDEPNTSYWSKPKAKAVLTDNDKRLLKNLISGTEKLVQRKPTLKNGLDERDIYKNNKSFEIEGKHRVKDYNDAVNMMSKLTRGVQFGNAMPDDERKQHMIAAAKSLEDLSKVTGVSMPALLQGGKVGLAFGARGHGSAAAHYEPGNRVINMTRQAGFGSLAHELGHALDHFSGEVSKNGSYLSKSYDKESNLGKSFLGVNKIVEDMQNRITNTASYNKMTPKQRHYWTSRHEVFARLFEGYVKHKLSKSGTKNTYLVSVPEKSELWPSDEELKSVEKDMDSFLKNYDSEVTRAQRAKSA